MSKSLNYFHYLCKQDYIYYLLKVSVKRTTQILESLVCSRLNAFDVNRLKINPSQSDSIRHF